MRSLMIKYVVLIFALSTLVNCKKVEIVPTENEQVTFLKEIIKSSKIIRIIAGNDYATIWSQSFIEAYGVSFRFEKNFFISSSQGWNLNQLKKYEIVERGNEIVLLLLF